ncbi:hypothetical protein [Streptomyces sp. NPDC048340]|uniref:hypothetical protein n=1 Tax=Streptomyces sp. NPDC048340 TaxID=3365537 RepID=UPI00371CD2BB
MEYRESRVRVPLDDKKAAQKSVSREMPPQVNPIRSERRDLTWEDGARPGVPHSAYEIHPDVQRRDGARLSGSYSTILHNDHPRENWSRRMRMDDSTEYGHAMRRATGTDAYYYRNGRPKLSVAGVPAEFRNGLEAGYEEV